MSKRAIGSRFGAGAWVCVLPLIGCGNPRIEAAPSATRPSAVEHRFDVEVPVESRVLVDLEGPRVVAPDDVGADAWDLAFQGLDVFTNSGPSGPGAGAAFGPLEAAVFQADTAPSVPFLVQDEVGGALADWYLYDQHLLRTRFHVYAIKDGPRFWKVQILGYYGDDAASPVSGMYTLRYAELSDAVSNPTIVITDLQGTGGSGAGPDDAPSECVNLGSGERKFLTAADAQADATWHLCFRHASIVVNGGLSGALGVTAADLDSASLPTETAGDVRGRSPDSELPRFESIGYSAVVDPNVYFVEDGIVSAFTHRWLEAASATPEPSPGAWLVYGSDGATAHLVKFDSLDASVASAATVRLLLKTFE
jgi:hypothetical protein